MAEPGPPDHAALRSLRHRDGELLVGALPISEVCRLAGGTPFYAYDRAAMEARVDRLRDALPAGVKVHYAIKANPMPEVVRLMAARADGLDVASGAELELALTACSSPQAISFAGPGKQIWEIERAVETAVVLNVESERELERAIDAGDRLGARPQIAVRINPEFELRASGLRMGGGARPFGIDAERVPQVLQRVAASKVDFAGLQLYCGSQCLQAESIGDAWDKSFELAEQLLDGAGLECPLLNVGGGFGIPYFPGDEPLDLDHAAGRLAVNVERLASRRPSTRVVIELGRYLVGEAGVYVCRVLDRKRSRGELFLVTDGGLHHNLAATGNLGQVVRRNYPVCVASRLDAPAAEPATVVGPLCTPLDVLALRMPLAAAEPGDLIAVLQSGAYGLSASPTAFLGHPPPREVLV